MPKKRHILTMASMIMLICSCNYYKHIPESKSILWDDQIKVEGFKRAPGEAYSILKQDPVYRFLWVFAPGVGIYNWGNGTDSNFFSKVGEEPVVFDSIKTITSTRQLTDYYFNNGYFEATGSFSTKKRANGRRTLVTYHIQPGSQYYIRNIETEFPNNKMRNLYTASSREKEIKNGEKYNTKHMNRERERITNIFRNNGYYNFSKNFITYEADTFLSGDSVDLRMIVSKRPVSEGDTISYQDHESFSINQIYIRPDHNYSKPDIPDDTTKFRGYTITYDELNYKPRYLTDAVHMTNGELYDQQKIKETYSHLLSYNAFQNIDISFVEVAVDSSGPLLDIIVKAAPLKKKTFTIETEGTTTSGNFGVNLSLGWLNRNIFRAGEELQIKLNSGIDYQSALSQSQLSRTFEIGAEIGIKFPRFLLPFNTVGLMPKRMRPTSRISIYGNRFFRAEFDRETFGSKLSYFWKESEQKSWQVDLLDLSYSRLYSIDDDFKNRLNEIQRIAFDPALISATRLIFTLNQQVNVNKRSYHFFKASTEVAGTSFFLLESTGSVGSSENDRGQATLGGVPYFQYVTGDVDYRFYWNTTRKSAWVNRLYMATIRAYGNSFIKNDDGKMVRNAPFSKFLFIGGSNDLRAWPAYRLGSGIQPNTNYFPTDAEGNYDKGAPHDTSFALGTIKILFNSEYRFPLFSYFKGAIFVDAGNIWLNGGLEDGSTDFKLSDILGQFAIGGGIGLRMDFDYFLIRFDVAAKIRDPGRLSMDEPDPWVLDNYPFRNLTYNIALGYPF